MQQFHLTQSPQSTAGMSFVTNQVGDIAYYITGEIGQPGHYLQILDKHANPLATITQISTGLLPRFSLTVAQQQVGSIGLSMQLREILFVSGVNWLILGNLDKQNYQIFNGRHQLAHTTAATDGRLNLIIFTNTDPAPLILVLAFLDRWRHVASSGRISWRRFTQTFGPAFEPTVQQIGVHLPKNTRSATLRALIKSHIKSY